jgi:hypothetical protein
LYEYLLMYITTTTMVQAAFYIGGVFGAAWVGLVLFVGVRSLALSLQQKWFDR